MATVEQLGAPDEKALTSLLARDPIRNLHLLGLLSDFLRGGKNLEVHGCRAGDAITAAVWVDRPRGRVLPTAGGNPDEFRAIAEHLKPGLKLGSIVGDKTAVEPLEAALANGRPRLHYLHRVFWVGPDQLGPYLQPRLRSAVPADLPQLFPLAINGFCEALGAEPDSTGLEQLKQQIEQNVLEGRTYVLELDGKLVFKADVAWRSPHGAEVSGLYTVPDHRHRGLATLALGQLSRHLLSALPRLTLRGNEAVSRVARHVGYECRPVAQLLVTHGG